MPLNLVLVRHGESWLNWLFKAYSKGDPVPEELCGTPGWKLRLTDEGREQAQSVEPLLASLGIEFEMGYCSPFIRTIETALNILPQAPVGFWRIFAQIRERDWGEWECAPTLEQFMSRAEELARAKSSERMFWSPPEGESGHAAMLRCRDMIGTIARSSAENVIMSCHGELIEFTIRMFNDWGTLHDWDDHERMWGYLLNPLNCQVIHLTRIDPYSGETADHLKWAKSYVPWDTSHSNNRDWKLMERNHYSAADLRSIVEMYPANY